MGDLSTCRRVTSHLCRLVFRPGYFGPGSTQKSKIWREFFLHGIQQPHQIAFKSVMVMSGDHIDLTRNDQIACVPASE